MKYRVTYIRHDDRLFVGCKGVSFFNDDAKTARFVMELESAYNIDHDSIVVHVLDNND
jgi:hypothetical protein